MSALCVWHVAADSLLAVTLVYLSEVLGRLLALPDREFPFKRRSFPWPASQTMPRPRRFAGACKKTWWCGFGIAYAAGLHSTCLPLRHSSRAHTWHHNDRGHTAPPVVL